MKMPQSFKKILLSGAFSIEDSRLKLFGDMDWSLFYSRALASALQSIAEEKDEEYLFELGYKATNVGGKEFKDKIGIESTGWNKLSQVAEMLDFLGYGTVNFTRSDIEDLEHPRLELHAKDNPTVEQAKELFEGQSKICGFFGGVYLSHLEMELGIDNVKLSEEQCMTEGAPNCTWKTVEVSS